MPPERRARQGAWRRSMRHFARRSLKFRAGSERWRPAAAYGLQVAREAESFERDHAELLFEQAHGLRIEIEDPFVEWRLDGAEAVRVPGAWRRAKSVAARGSRISRGRRTCSSSLSLVSGAGAGKFGGAKFAGREIDVGQADGRAGGMRARWRPGNYFLCGSSTPESVAVPGVTDADDFAADEFLALGRLPRSARRRRLVTGTDQAGDVIFRGVIGNAAHRYRLVFFVLRAVRVICSSFRGDQGIVIEKFVEIAEAEHQQRAWILAFDRVVLRH